MSYKVEVRVIGESTFSTNGIAMATEDEAMAYGRDLASRWIMVDEWRVFESDEKSNYKIDTTTGKATAIK